MAAKKSFLHYLLLILHFSSHNSLDIITTNQTFQDGHLLVSENGKFAFGFFTPGRSIHRYVGIWFHNISEFSVVWVANRNSPINGSSGFLSFNQYGNLVLYNDPRRKTPLWFTNISGQVYGPCVAQLLGSGNLVLLQGRNRIIVWQSFDYLTDTFVPGTKAGKNPKTGQEWSLTSWRSPDDPGTGKFSVKVEPRGTPQLFLYEGSKPRHTQHIWPHRRFSDVYNYGYNRYQEEAYVVFDMNDTSITIIATVDYAGTYKWMRWSESVGQWKEFMSVPKHLCDFNDEVALNSSVATKIYVNPEIPEILEFLESIRKPYPVLHKPMSTSSQLVGIESEKESNRKTIEELLQVDIHTDKGIKFSCKAKIKEVDPSEGWWYRACPRCKSSIQNFDDKLWCKNCTFIDDLPLPWYRLRLVVEDGTGSTTFVLFGHTAADLVGIPANSLASSFKERHEIPPAMTKMYGIEKIFQIQLGSFVDDPCNITFKVMYIFNDTLLTPKKEIPSPVSKRGTYLTSPVNRLIIGPPVQKVLEFGGHQDDSENKSNDQSNKKRRTDHASSSLPP